MFSAGRKYHIKTSVWSIVKIGTSRNLVFRVLCLKNSMAAKAPNGPKMDNSSSFDSGILWPLFLLLILSIPKAIMLMVLVISSGICRIV